MNLVALRGAITLEQDSREQVVGKTQRLVEEMLSRNGIEHDSIVSVIFTATHDIRSEFPAVGARAAGLGDIPLLCARELSVEGSTPLCIRVLMHVQSNKHRDDLRHVYLEGARHLRDDLPE